MPKKGKGEFERQDLVPDLTSGVSMKKSWVTLRFLDWVTAYQLVSSTELGNTKGEAGLVR